MSNIAGDLGMLHLDALVHGRCHPKKGCFCPFDEKFIAGMSRGMARQRDELHAVDDWLGATKTRAIYRPSCTAP